MNDTIAAISTAPGEAGIGIVRISGPESLDIMKRMMKGCPDEVIPRHAYYGKVVKDSSADNIDIIDEAVFIFMREPFSYTGEDMLEIQAHGSNVSLRKILSAVIHDEKNKKNDAGIVRMAEPGEFTKLAFLNGKIDLTQAESVIDIIKSKSDISLQIAESQREGRLGKAIKDIREKMLDILAVMAVNIDFPDEDEYNTGGFDKESVLKDLYEVRDEVKKLLDTAAIGKIAKEGIRISIIGKPNAGKSSLMNAVLGEGRVIVTDIPGTTRDVIEEYAYIGDIPVVISDTAGLRNTEDIVEKIGIEKTIENIKSSDIVIFVIDGNEKFEDAYINDIDLKSIIRGNRTIVVVNKEDLGIKIRIEDIKKSIPDSSVIITSVIENNGIDAVEKISEEIKRILDIGIIDPREMNIVSNERHKVILENSLHNLEEAADLIINDEPLEVAELSANYAYKELGVITGEEAGEEVLDRVFSKFCLGK